MRPTTGGCWLRVWPTGRSCPRPEGATTRAATSRTRPGRRSARSSRRATPPTRASTTTGARPRRCSPLLERRMRGASAGKTMYVVPYLMAPPGSPLERFAAGVELTDCRTVVLHMIRMARVGAHYVDDLTDQNSFVRAVHVTGDLENLGQGTPDDQALLRDGCRRADHPALRLVLRRQRAAGQDRARAAPSLLRRLGVGRVPRRAVHADRHHRQADRPDVSRLRRIPERIRQDQPGDDARARRAGRPLPGRLLRRRHRLAASRPQRRHGPRRINPEFGVFGVAKDTNEATQPDRPRTRSAPGTGTLFTNVAYNDDTEAGLVGGPHAASRPPTSPAGKTGRGTLISDRPAEIRGRPVGAPQQPFHDHAGQRAEHRAGLR